MRIRTQRLPTGYREVEYLESTGTQYIDTGYTCVNGMRCIYDGMWLPSTYAGYLVGSHNVSSPYGRNSLYMDINRGFWELGYGEVYPQNTGHERTYSKKYHIEFQTFTSNAYGIVNGTTLFSNYSGQTTINNKVYLFCAGEIGISANKFCTGRIYTCKIWSSSNSLVRNFIPCIRTSDNKPGMYDVVSNQFYINQGTGEFLYGPYSDGYKLSLHPRLPNAYQEVEYIQSSGTQWIDLGLPATNVQRQYIEFGWTISSPQVLNGSIDLDQTDGSFSGLVYVSGHPRLFFYPNANPSIDTGRMIYGNYQKETYDILMNGYGSTYVVKADNVYYHGTQNKYASPTLNMYLFYCNTSEATNRYINQKAKGRLWTYKLWQNNILVRDLVPCYRKSDNVVGLFDLVHQQFYTNSGTGAFTKGADVNTILSCMPSTIIEGTTNLLPANVRQLTSIQGAYYSGTRTITTQDGYKCLAVTNNTSNSYTDGVIFNGVTLTAGTQYTASAKIKTPCTVRFSLRNNKTGGWTSSKAVYASPLWQTVSFTFTANTDNASNQGVLECVETSANSTSYTWYIRDLQIEQKDHATLFVDGTRPNNTII